MSVVDGITDAQEAYLEAVYILETDQGVARVKGVTSLLGVKAPSVTVVMQALAAKGLIVYERYGVITLTERGRKAGRALLLRRRAVQDFLSSVLGVQDVQAREVAEQIEHHVPEAVLCRLVQFVDHYRLRVRQKYLWRRECAQLCGSLYGSDCVKVSERRRTARRTRVGAGAS
jgi:Mn-dependent DtxR family transcriptional regulator